MDQEVIIYISKATRPLSSEETAQISAAAAHKNRKLKVTGLLLQVGNYFVQVLEGHSEALSFLLEKITADNRHTEVRVIYKAPDHSRMFAQWNMGFFNIEQHYSINRCDFAQLRQFTEKAFAHNETSKEAIVQVIKALPALMQTCETKKPEMAFAGAR